MTIDAAAFASVDENVKSQAEEVLNKLGIPVSVVINSLYHQIIIQQGVPFPITLIKTPTTSIEGLTEAELDAKLQHSYEQAMARQGRPLNAVFADLERKHA